MLDARQATATKFPLQREDYDARRVAHASNRTWAHASKRTWLEAVFKNPPTHLQGGFKMGSQLREK